MNLFTKARLVLQVLRWRRSWNRRDTRFRFTVPGNPKFMGSRDALELIHDGDVIATSGIAGNQPMAILYWAIREVFEETGHPANLTVLCTGGQGGRGAWKSWGGKGFARGSLRDTRRRSSRNWHWPPRESWRFNACRKEWWHFSSKRKAAGKIRS
jgi:hypothetical protein